MKSILLLALLGCLAFLPTGTMSAWARTVTPIGPFTERADAAPGCDLQITKTASTSSTGTVTYTVTVQNVGTGPCGTDRNTPNSLQDLAPVGVTFGPPTILNNNTGWTCPYSNGAGVGCINPTTIPAPSPLGLPTLDPGAVDLTFTGTVEANVTNPIQNCATTNGLDDPYNSGLPGNNRACVIQPPRTGDAGLLLPN